MMEENQEVPQDGSAELDWFGRSPLMNAIICSNDNRIALELIANGVNINAKDNGGNTALMYAVIKDNKEIVRALSQANVNVNDCNKHGITALFEAVDSNNNVIAEMLIENGADVNAAQYRNSILDLYGYTPLMCSASEGNLRIVNSILNVSNVDVNAKDNQGNTALIYAIIGGNRDIVSALLHANAKVNDCNNHGSTALFKAVDTNNKEIADMLIKSGADVNMSDEEGQTALFVAVNHNNNDMTAMLIENRANVNVSCKYEGIDEYTPLMLAAKKGNLEIAKALLHAQANVNTFNMHMPSALFLAVDNNNKELVELLIENDADVNLFNCAGFTALMVAVRNENIDIVRVLLQAKADVNARRISNENTALFFAIVKDNREIVELLIKRGADVNLFCDNVDDEYDLDIFTPLMVAVRNENIEIVRVLLQAKADVNARSKTDKNTAHSLAIVKDNREIVELLIKSGADVNLFCDNMEDEYECGGLTPLMVAVANENIDIVRLLLQAEADVNARRISNKNTALFFAIVKDNREIVELLIEKKADVNLFCDNDDDEYDCDGFTPLMVAVRNENIEIVRVLLQAKVDVNAISKQDNKTALFLAVVKDNREIVELLIESGADHVNIFCNYMAEYDLDIFTPLMVAVRNENIDIVRALLQAKADVNARSITDKVTALILAIGKDNREIVELLIEYHADVNLFCDNVEDEYDCAGFTPLMVAVKSGNLDVVKTLFHAGADLNARNIYGRTPLFYTTNKSVDVVAARLLLENGAQFNQTDGLGFSVISCFMEKLCELKHVDSDEDSDDDEIKENDVIGLIKEFDKTDKIFTSVINILYRKLPYSICSDTSLICTVRLARKCASNEHEKKMIEKLHNFEKIEEEKLPEMFDLLYRLGAHPNNVDSYGNTALHNAVELPCFGASERLTMEIIGKLEEHGARVNVKNNDGWTPLLYCLLSFSKLLYGNSCRHFKTAHVICKHLLKYGHLAIEIGKHGESLFHLLLKLLNKIFDLSDRDIKEEVLRDIIELMKLFSPPVITHGVIVNKRDDQLKSPLHLWASLSLPQYKYQTYASNLSGELTFESLLKLVFNHIRMCGIKLNARDEEDQTPLHYCQTWSAVQCLVEAGAKRNDIDSMGRPPLLAAAHKRIFMQNPKHFFPDVTYDPKSFFKKSIDMGLDLWDHDNDGESILSLLLSSESFELAQGLVESACEEKTSVLGQLLVTICEDQNIHTVWKSSLVGKILACPKEPQGKDLDFALRCCCLTMKTLYEQREMIFENEKEVEEPPFKKAREDTSFRSIHNDSSNSSTVSVHLDIANQLRVQGANSERCIDLCANIEELKTFLTKAIDYKKAPLSIPWTSYSHNHVDKLERVARRQNVESINSYWYHKEPIGSGSFGDVFAGISQKDGREIAIKKIVKRNMNRPQDIREITTLTALADCSQVVKYIYYDDTDDDFAYVVLELMEGNLDDYLNSSLYDSHQSLSLCQDLIMGLNYLHSHRPAPVLHRDLKPENILYKNAPKLCLKIADFGMSSPLSTTGTTVLGTNAGTRCWIAPEVIYSSSYRHTKESDNYSCGLLLHYILSRQKHPFRPVDCCNKSTAFVDHETQANMLKDVMEGFDVTLSPAGAHLIRGLLSKEPDKRPSAADSLSHPLCWSNDKKMEFLCVFAQQPRERSVAADIKNKFATIVKHPTWNDANYRYMPNIYKKLSEFREYDTESVQDLIAFIRNAKAHFHDLNRTLKRQIVKHDVFLDYFPHLVIEVYETVIDHGWDKKFAINKVMSRNENTR